MTKIFQLMGFSLIKYLIAGVVIALVLAIHPGNAQASPLNIEDCIKALPPGYTEPLFSGLGNHKYPTLTNGLKSKKAKDYFNQGMTLFYAFNHPEAIHSFNQAAKYEPEAAMPYWGIAMAAGPDINVRPTDKCLNLADKAVQRAIRNAKYKFAPSSSPPELDYAETELDYAKALSERYYRDMSGKVHYRPEAYAEAMKRLKDKHKYKDDLDAATLYADAEMNSDPWKWWTEGKSSPEIKQALKVLIKVLYDSSHKETVQELLKLNNSKSPEENPSAKGEVRVCELGDDQIPKPKSNHIGANHYFIHATEQSYCPKVALPSADRIAALAPAAGHIQHMPSHVYQRIGEHAKATEANYKAVYVDRAYVYQTSERARYPLHYLSHNLHFLTDSLSIQGRSREALAAAHESNKFIEKVKNRLENYPVLNQDSALFERDIERNKRIIEIWKKAVCLEDGLNYNEPSDWYYPLRESLGAAYYRQTKYEDAKKVFCKDLQIHECEYEKEEIHKMNGRSLFGLIMSLEERKKESEDDSEKLPKKLDISSIGSTTETVQQPQSVSETKFCDENNPDEVIKNLCKKLKEAWKNATVKPSLETM